MWRNAEMPRYKYHPPFRITYRYNCNFSEYRDSLKEAIRVGMQQHPESLITIHAEAVFAGHTVPRAHVGVYACQLDGKSEEECMELFDQDVDDYIACRVKTGHWGFDHTI